LLFFSFFQILVRIPRLLPFLLSFLLVLIPLSIGDAIEHIKQRLHEQISPNLLKVTFDLLDQHHNPRDLTVDDSEDLALYTDYPLTLKPARFVSFNSTSGPLNDSDEQDSQLFTLPPVLQPLARSRRSVSSGAEPILSLNQPEDPPILDALPDSFMHSFVAGSGIGNRELVRITSIGEHPLQVQTPQLPLGWQYSRFNSSDYVACRQLQHVHIWRQQFPAGTHGFRFDSAQAICHVHVSAPAQIHQTLFYTRVLQDEELLHLAVTLRTSDSSYQLRTYELVARGACIPSLTVELGQTPPIKIAHVRSHYFGALAVLLDGAPRGTPIVSRLQKGRETSANVLAVRAQNAVDIEPFHMHGFAYFAVAHASGVDVFKLDEFLQRHQAYDSIALSGVRDVLAFRSGVEQHLAIATNTIHQHVFVWRDGSFVRQQVLRVANVLQWLPLRVHTCRDDLFVGLLRDDPAAPLLLYQYHTTTRRLQLESDSMARHLSSPMRPIPLTQTTFSYNSTSFLLQPDVAGFTRLIAFDTTLQQLPDPLFDRQFQLSNFVRSLHARLSAQQTALRSVRDTLDHAVGAFGRLPVVKVSNHIRDLRSSQSVLADQISHVRSAHWQGTSLTLADTQTDLARIRSRLNSARSRARTAIDEVRRRAVLLSSPQTQLAGRKRFIGSIQLDSLLTSTLDMITIANVSINPLVHDLWLRDQPNPRVSGLKRFVQPPTISGRFDSLQFNSQPSPFAVALDATEPITIDSPIDFVQDLRSNSLHIAARLNRWNVSSDLIYIDDPTIAPQVVSGPIDFASPLINVHNLHAPSISSVDVVRLRHESLTIDTPQQVFTPIHVNHLALHAPLSVRNQINNFDVRHLTESLVRQDRPVRLEGDKVFVHSLHVNDLRVAGPINNVLIPSQLVSSSRPQDVFGRKSISSLQFRNHLFVNQTLNGFQYPQDVLTTTLNEDIATPVVLVRGFSAVRDVQVSGLTDGLQLAKFARYMDRREMVLFGHTRFDGPVHVRGDLHVDGLISGQNVTFLADELVVPGRSQFKMTASKHFDSSVTFAGGLTAPIINQLPTKHLIDTRAENILNVPLRLQAPHFERMLVRDQKINDLNLLELLTDRISLQSPGPMIGNKRFASLGVDTVIRVHGTVNGLQPNSDLIFINSIVSPAPQGQRVTGSVRFTKNVQLLGSSTVQHLKVAGHLNRVNVTRLLQSRIALDQESLVAGSIHLMDSDARFVRLPHDSLFNGVGFDRLIGNWLRKDVAQNVLGPKHFVGSIRFDAPSDLDYLNGLSTRRLMHSTLRSNGQQTIDSDVIVAGPLRVAGSVLTRNGLDGIHLAALQRDTPLVNSAAHFSAPCHFAHGLDIQGSLGTDRVNDLHLNRDLLLLSGDQHVSGHLTVNRLSVSGPVRSSSGRLNHVSLGDLDRNVIRSDRPNVLAGDVIVDQQTFAFGDVKLRGRLTNVNLTRLTSFALNKRGDQRLHRLSIAPQSVTTFAQLEVEQVNGIHWQHFVRDVLLKNGAQTQDLGVGKRFRRVQLQGAYRLPSLHATCPINDLDLDDLARRRIPLRSKQPIQLRQPVHFDKRVYFNGPLQLDQRLNGVRIPHDVLRIDSAAPLQQVNGNWQLVNGEFGQSILLNGTLNGRSLNQLVTSTLLRQGDQHVAGVRDFRQQLDIASGLEIGSLNGRPLSWQQLPFVRLDTVGQLPVRFVQPLRIQNDLHVSGLIDGVNVSDWTDNLLHLSGRQQSTAQIRMDSLRADGHFTPQAPVNGINLAHFLAQLDQFEGSLNNGSHWLKQQMAKQLKLSRDLLSYVRRSTLQLQGFELSQQLPGLFGDHISADPLGVFDTRVGFQSLQFDSNPTVAGGRFLPLVPSLQRRNTSIADEMHYIKRRLPSNDNDGQTVQLFVPPVGREQQVLLKQADQQLFSFGSDVDLVRSVRLSDGSTLIGALSGIAGKLSLYMLVEGGHSKQATVRPLGFLGVGSESSDFTLFEMDQEVYVAVARGYGHLCPITDFGTLLFRWNERSSFQLVQRIAISDASLLQHVQFNGNDYLIVYEADPPGDDQLLSGRLHVFRRQTAAIGCQFTLMQQLYAPRLTQLQVFAFGPSDRLQLFVLGMSRSQLYLWRYYGHSGFELSWTTDLVDAATVRPLLLNQQLYLLTTQHRSCSGSRVYRALTTGATQFPLQLNVASDGLPAQWNAVTLPSN
jgi:hypothetical protein